MTDTSIFMNEPLPIESLNHSWAKLNEHILERLDFGNGLEPITLGNKVFP